MVWSGKELLVWGGRTFEINSPWLNDGWRYDPSKDVWDAMNSAGAPGARQFPIGVWTGKELVVWGGHRPRNPPDSLRNGGAYDPLTDQWRPLSEEGAPSKRGDHTMIWTGTEVIVWGGFDLDGARYFNDGGLYDPRTDTWEPLFVIGAPSPRSRHAAIWTGSRCVIWGGGRLEGGIGDIHFEHAADFASYDPRTNQWRHGEGSGAPTARSDHSAVWSGGEMLVWGGWSGRRFEQYLLEDGAGYDPVADSWRPLPLSGAPGPRALHTAASVRISGPCAGQHHKRLILRSFARPANRPILPA